MSTAAGCRRFPCRLPALLVVHLVTQWPIRDLEIELSFQIAFPYRWGHQVTSLFRNIAVNIWWTPLQRFNSTDCEGIFPKR